MRKYWKSKFTNNVLPLINKGKEYFTPVPIGFTYFTDIKQSKSLTPNILDLIRSYVDYDVYNYWKSRFSNDVLPLINKGYKYIYIEDERPCVSCYEQGYGNHYIGMDDNGEDIFIDHAPNKIISFDEYLSYLNSDILVLVKTNYEEFKNWSDHWNGKYYTCMDELKCKTYKINCCSDVYPCGGKSYYEGWLCDNHSQKDLHNYMVWADADGNPGIRTIGENGDIRITIDVIDHQLSSFIHHDDCLYTSQRLNLTEDDIIYKKTSLSKIYSPLIISMHSFNISDFSWEHTIDDSVFINYDKCIFQMRNTLPQFIDLESKNYRRDSLILSGYFSGVSIYMNDIEMFIDYIWDYYYVGITNIGLIYRNYISNVLSLY